MSARTITLARQSVYEIRALLVIALPLVAAYLAEIAMFAMTKVIVGRLGYQQLAAAGLAGNLAFELVVVLMGLLSIVGVLAAQAEGAARRHDAGRAARQGLVVATLTGVPATLLIWHLDSVMALTGQRPVVVELATPFLHGLCGFLLPTLYFAVLRNFVAALAHTGSVMIITVVAVAVNALLTLALVHGFYPLPALGLFGAGLALTLTSWLMFLALLGVVYFRPALRGYGVFRAAWRLEPALCWTIIRLGTPVAALVALEAGLFVAVALLSGRFGAVPLASFEVLITWVGIPFVIALGLAEATMVRVAHGVGRGSAAGARRAGLLGMLIGVVVVGLLVVVPLSFGEYLQRAFLDPGDAGYADVAALLAQLFGIVALFQVFDGLQAIASRALRGIKDVSVPLVIGALGYWLLGIGGGSLLAFRFGWGPTGLWWGLAAGLAVTGLLLALRFERLTRGPTLPPDARVSLS